MQKPIVESHPFAALLPPQVAVIMMGTFPPKEEKHTVQFHYPNFQNDMWRAYELVFFGNTTCFQKQGEKAFDADKIKILLSEKDVASCPTVLKAIREHDSASDKFLRAIKTVGLAAALTQMPECYHLHITGGKATEILLEVQGGGMRMPKTDEAVPFPYAGRGLALTRLPSTSRTYPLSLAEKVAAYRAFFETAGLTVSQE